MTPQKFYPESAVAEKIGIPRDELKLLRVALLKKKKGHWKKDGRQVVLSETGLDRILKSLSEQTGADRLLIGDFDDCAIHEKKDPNLVELTVKKIFPNPRLLLATLPEEGGDVRVRVPSSDHFRPKMKLNARLVDEKGIYRLVGRCPRYPGRW